MKLGKSVLFRTLTLCIFIVLITSLLNVQPTAALSVSDYFTLSYQVTLSTTEVSEGQTFNAIASGSGTCNEELPISVSSAIIEGRVVAINQATGTEVTLNAGYTVTITPFPNKLGETLQLTQTIPLTFPAGSPAGIYTIIGELMEAKVNAVIWWDVSSYLPSSQTIGTVNYVVNNSNATGNGNGGNAASGTTTITTPTAITPRLALFKVGSLLINPTTVKHGGKVNISTQITNIGDVAGTDTVTLKINNLIEGSKDVTLAGGESEVVTFTTSHNLSGVYLVEVAGLNGSFNVSKNIIQPLFWLIIIGVIILGVIIGLGIRLLRRKKA
jgi:hypothetical protein